MKEKKYVFIGGLHRSGTSLFAKCLSQHPNISSFKNTNVPEDEGEFLQSVYPNDNCYGGPGRFAFDKSSHLTELSNYITQDNRERLYNEWNKYWDLSKNVMIDKSPPTIIQSRFLQSMFPNSYFIFIIRHPVATSLATHKWSGTGIYSLINHWVHAHKIMLNDLIHLKNYAVIKYESFINNPKKIICKIEDIL